MIQTHLVDLDELVQTVRDINAREYIAEAIAAYRRARIDRRSWGRGSRSRMTSSARFESLPCRAMRPP